MSNKSGKNKDESTMDRQNEDNKDNNIIGDYSTIEQFTKEGYKTLMEAIRHSNALPCGGDWNFYTTHESFLNIVNNEGNRVQSVINSILRRNEIEGNIRNRVLEEKTELLVEANDVILERVANNIDEMNGIRKTVNEPVIIQTVSAHLPINGSWNRVNNATFSVTSSITSAGEMKKQASPNAIRLLTAKNILRPQKFFKDKIENSSKYPWEPKIKDKPNSLKPLAIFLEETQNGEEYSHPYEFELERFKPTDEQLQKQTVVAPKPVKGTPLIEIDKPEQLNDLVETLRSCKEFAVDLEHHSYRSFMGITCLMQISTRDKDYIVDTLALRDKLHVLNEVFTKPTIVKIFHGADMDVLWLQRDLSLYVVGMFDTHQAARQLEFSGLSLAYLMQRYCNFVPNKQFQLADWRIRPLPEELKSYAREDTHYLIYIYEMMKNELLKKGNGQDNLLRSVIQRSNEICKKRYFKPVLREDSHLDFYRRCKRLFDNRQLYALKELYTWRDHISREEDESTGYVLPNHMLLQISESLPREMQGILACCNPIPPLVRSNLLELHKIILKAREQPLEKPILKEDTRARGTTKKISKINVDSPLHCPHDLTRSSEFRDDLPTLLGGFNESIKIKAEKLLAVEKNHSIYSVFNTPGNSENKDKTTVSKKLHSITFLGPFERYKLVKPFIQAEEKKLADEKAKQLEEAEKKGSKEQAAEDERTDEDRIESIRKHFLTLSRINMPQEPKKPPNASLIEMGGTKKRKRELSPPLETIHPDYQIPENELHTPVPNLNSNQNRKRKSSDTMQSSPNKVGRLDNESQGKQHKKKNKKDKQNRQFNQNEHTESQQSNRPVHTRFDEEGTSVDRSSDNIDYRNQRGGNNGQRRGGKNKNRGRGGQGQQRQHNGDFTPYDYSSVDFRQFQGGAGGVQKPKEFKSKFRGKGKKRGGNRGQNRSGTFGRGQAH